MQCKLCKKEVEWSDFQDDLARKEFGLSGMCQACQDDFFGKTPKPATSKAKSSKMVKFHGKTLKVRKGYYTNGRLCIILMNKKEEYMTATVNIPDTAFAPDEVAIKNYSENEGVLDALVAANVVEPPHRNVPSGMITIPICKVNI